MISIIVPVIYRADLARVCIDSIYNYTNIPFELILVWEGTDVGVGDLLNSYKEAKLVHNLPRKGFAGAMNSGLAVATGDYYCFLNSDTVVTPGWLEKAIKAFEDKEVGLVTPTFTEMPPRQVSGQDDSFEYVSDPLFLKGVCFIISKEAIEKIGNWDESFGLGGGDDNDMCHRLNEAGYKLVIAKKSYIYHYGSASFRVEFNNDEDYSKKFAVSQFNKYRKKYGIKEDKPKIFISVPCVGGTIHYELALRLMYWLRGPEMNVSIRFYPGLKPLDNARNRAVKDFLEGYDDYFFHIDDHIIPPENTLKELIKADKYVIAPTCFIWKQGDDGIPFPMPLALRYDEKKQYRPCQGNGVEEVDAITGGCHLVKREVMEKLERPYYFTYHKNGLVIYSEDMVFSQQCQELGYKLYNHFGLLCKHYKNIDIKDVNDLMIKYGGKQ